MKDHELIVLEVVGLSDGRLDTRHLDFEYYSRSQVLLAPNILRVLVTLSLDSPVNGGPRFGRESVDAL